ncbi:MAG: hypothetical protein WCJ51_02140 [Candidatus Moraniibacteriota bacterium]
MSKNEFLNITRESEQTKEAITAEEFFEFEQDERSGKWLKIEKGQH